MPKKNKQKANMNWYMETYSEWPDGTKVYDWEVGDYVKKHLRLTDRLNLRKVSAAMQTAFCILNGSVDKHELPKKKNWKFFKDY